jgi:hypothetical protein
MDDTILHRFRFNGREASVPRRTVSLFRHRNSFSGCSLRVVAPFDT